MDQILDDVLAITGESRFSNCYVKNFSTDLDDQGLKELFAEFGEIRSARVMKDERGNSRGFGFVSFIKPESAEAAVNAMNNKEINGQKLYVNRAQSKVERQRLLQQQYSPGRNLYVKNLDDTIDDARLKEAFSKCGNITSAKVMLDENGNSKGFGFVCFSSPEEAKEGMKLHGTFIGSKPVYVGLAQRLEERRATLMGANSPPNNPDFSEQPSYPANAAMSPPLRWNRAIARPQGLPRVEAASSSRPNYETPYVGGATSAAMGQGQLISQGNIINPQFHGQAGAHNVMPNPMTGLVAGSSDDLVAGQQYGTQFPGMPGQLPGAIGSESYETIPFIPAPVMPESIAQPNVQLSTVPTGTVARLNRQSPQSVMIAHSHGPHTVVPPIHAKQTYEPRGYAAASTSAAGARTFLTGVERHVFGNKLYQKIVKYEHSLAGELTGMIIQMDRSFVLQILDSDEKLMKLVEEYKLKLSR